MMNTAKRARKDTLETRRQMVDAAEALFAEHGVDNVTLLDIARASGQKNRNAPQYHFGDKEGLLNAVLDKHSDLISVRRKAMIDALAGKKSPTLRELVDAFVLPIALHVDSTPNSLAYLLINSQLMTSGAYAPLTAGRADRYPEVRKMNALMKAALPKGSHAKSRAKMLLIQGMVFHGLASYYGSGKSASSSKVFIDTLCASVEAVLA